MRHHHKSAVLAAAAVAALSLGLTACGGGDGATGAKDAGNASAQVSAGATDNGAATAGTADQTAVKGGSGSTGSTGGSGSTGASTAGSTTSGGTGSKGSTGGSSTGSTGSTGGGSSTGKTPACAYGDIKVTVKKADEVPTEHIVLTATNVSGRSCTLLKYPLLAFGQLQTAKDVPPVAKSKPASPVVLKPGAPAYANVRIALGGAHEDNKVVQEFDVNLFAADGPAEGTLVVKAPAGGLAVDDAVAKTGYWTEQLRNGADEF